MEKTLAQKILLSVVYGLIVLMIFFSIQARANIGQEGFNKCVQKKCEEKGEKFCQKARELNNCCLGAGGTLVLQNNKPICQFS